jgi:hypothetical protein
MATKRGVSRIILGQLWGGLYQLPIGPVAGRE